MRTLQKRNIGIGVLQETKLTERIHTHYSAGYKVWEMKAGISHRVGITISC